MSRTDPSRLALLAGVGLSAGTAVRAAWVEPRRLVVRRVTVALPGWPEALEGVRVGVISDLHTGAPHVDLGRVRRVVARMNAQRPDLVALLGDYVDPTVALGTRVAPDAVAACLAGLRAPLGVLAVLGNHDWAHEGERMRRALRGAGLEVLEDEARPVPGPAGALWVVGLADATRRRPDVAGALDGIPPDAVVLALTHDPDLFPRVAARAALTISGHTHGGQVDLPGVRRLVLARRYRERFAAGHHVEAGRHLFVTRGVGTSTVPLRLRSPPEVAILTLTRERSRA